MLERRYDLETWHEAVCTQVYTNDDPELTLTHFKTMSNFAKLVTGPLVLWLVLPRSGSNYSAFDSLSDFNITSFSSIFFGNMSMCMMSLQRNWKMCPASLT